MNAEDFFRARLDGMVDPRHPLGVLTVRLPRAQNEQVLAPYFERNARTSGTVTTQDMPGEHAVGFGGDIGSGGRPRLPIRLMASLLYLKNSFNRSADELVARWGENVVWQFFSGMAYCELRLSCVATQIGRIRTAIGKESLEQLLKFTIHTAVEIKAIKSAELERVIVDSTVQETAIANPVDSRLLKIARYKVVKAAKAAGFVLKQTFAAEGKELRRKSGGCAEPGRELSSGQFVPGERVGLLAQRAPQGHARQFKRLKGSSSASARSWAW